MRIKINSLVFLLSLLIIFFVFYKGLNNKSIYKPNVDVKKDIPNFESKIFENQKIISSNEIFKAKKFYIMNIWASWCVPCRDEHPYLLNLRENSDIEIIGLNYKDDNENAKKFLTDLQNPYSLVLYDKDGTLAIEWGAYGVPETFVIFDKKVIRKFIGPLTKDSLTEINKLIK
tara:strand:- start:16 stop:534 length:519 start_codon:yes stop_codon:yes gene_type:complete